MLSASDTLDHPLPQASTKDYASFHEPDAAASLQTQAHQLKHELKIWEASFAKEHGRAPTKQDLGDISDITEKYKRYSRVKKLLGRRSSNAEEGVIAHKQYVEQAGHLESSVPRAHGNYRYSRMDLPLETSTLRGSIKRKTRHIHAVPRPLPTGPGAVPGESPPTSLLNDNGLVVAPILTPKRQRRALSIDPTKLEEAAVPTLPNVQCTLASESLPISLTGLFSTDIVIADETRSSGLSVENTGDDFDDADCDMVAYTPAPSLIRRYGTHKRSFTHSLSAEAPSTDPHPTYSPLLPSLSAMSVSDNATQHVEADATSSSTMALDLGINMSRFKARAGKLVKTTSIPLSTFGTQIKAASSLLAVQSNEEGDSQGTGSVGFLDGYPDQVDSGELVMDDCQDTSSLPAEEEGDESNRNVTKKKTTQKRSTRRVKIKPIDDNESTSNPSKRAVRPSSQNLVSSSFYKLKLKSRKRGNGSSEERRAALYKCMLGKQKKPSLGSNAIEDVCGHSTELDCETGVPGYAQETGNLDADDLYSAEGLTHNVPALVSEHSEVGSKDRTQRGDIARAIAGEPLSSFYADDSSATPDACLISPLFSPCVGSEPNDKVVDLGKVLRHVWGFDGFRQNQFEAMKQILGGRSTLLVLATGSGKSLVYQLPALVLSALFGGLTLVVTPLISLMRDQIQSLPSCLQAVCMSSEHSFGDSYADAKARIMAGKAQLLFVSPERMQSPRFQEMMAADGMPSVHFAVIDEAHCASEWSHNFRPAYLRLPQMLQRIGVSCVLAMTGTATHLMASRLCTMFEVNTDGGVVRGSAVRDNIELSVVRIDTDARSVSRTSVREESLVNMLKSADMAKLGSILVYVSTQANADRIAEYLTARSIPAQAYHAGKPASERARIQMAFMRKSQQKPGLRSDVQHAQGSGVPIRVLVATVAFGMGLDKSDIRAVIHFNLPRSMEAYVQEVGRAGRDGSPAWGVILLTTDIGNSLLSTGVESAPQCVDAVFIRSWAHADGVDIASIRRLLHQLFPPEFMQRAIATAADAHAKGLSLQSDELVVSRTTVLELKALEHDVDADHTVIQTLINYLALREPEMIRAEPNTHRKCRIRLVRTGLGKLADSHVFFKGIADYINGGGGDRVQSVRSRKPGSFARFPGARKTEDTLVVDIFELASHLCTTPSEVTTELYKWRAKKEVVLEWLEPSVVINVALDMARFAPELTSVNDDSRASASSAILDTKLLCEQLAQLVDRYITDLSEQISQQHGDRIRDNICRVNAIESTMLEAAQLESNLQNKLIQTSIQSYFSALDEEGEQGSKRGSSQPCDTTAPSCVDVNVRDYICRFIEQHLDKLSSGRAVARVLHGLSSPSSPASQWSWCAEWGSLVWTDFEAVRVCAQEELVRMRFAEGQWVK